MKEKPDKLKIARALIASECKNCYGKGYRTSFEGWHGSADFIGDKVTGVAPHVVIKICNYRKCERGLQIKRFFSIKPKYK